MGFHRYSSPYDWARVTQYKDTACAVPGGMVDLSIGSPVDPVPDSVREALAGAADDANAHGYPLTVGTPDLRAAMADWLRDCRGVENLDAIGGDMVPTVGSKESVSLMASLLFLGPGDVVVQPRAAYPTYQIGTQLAGATVYKVDDVADVGSWARVPGVKAVWVNSPNNPSGRTLDAAHLRAIVDAARTIGATVLSDECYAMMDWSPANAAAMADGTPLASSPCILRDDACGGTARGILMLYSLSKQSNMAGYRTAFIAGDRDIVATMADYRKQIGQLVPGPIQAAMAAGLRDIPAMRAQHARYHARLATLVDALRVYGYDAQMPDGALYVWVKALGEDCWADMADLAGRGIIASPGEFYGAPGYLRFSATATDAQIAEAARRLQAR